MARDNHSLVDMEYVNKLKDRLENVLNEAMKKDTNMFIRFLKARNYNLDAAENMLKNHIAWRDMYKVDDICNWYTVPEIAKYFSMIHLGFDKDDADISLCHFGNWDIRGSLKSLKQVEIMNYFIHHYERTIKRLEERSLKVGKTLDKMVYILDFENFSLKTATHKPSLDIIAKIVSSFEANYPERLKLAVLYNTSLYFQIAFAVIKPLISGPTIQKIKIFGKTGWQEELRKHIDCDVLPAYLGGARTDPDGDPRCRSFIPVRGTVPESFYITHHKSHFENQSDVRKIVINRLSKKLIELTVIHPDSYIEWEFEIKDKDIYFSLLFKEFKNSTEELRIVLPKQRFDASVDPETGVFKCEKSGIYFMEFDNSYSWIYQKEVYYKAQVVPSHTLNNAS